MSRSDANEQSSRVPKRLSGQASKRPSERKLSSNMCQNIQVNKHTNNQAHRQISHTTAKYFSHRHMNMHARESKQQRSKRESK